MLATCAVVAVAACTENIDSSAACPLLCPPQTIQLRDTVVQGVSFDSTLAGYPGIGLEPLLLLARRGDSLDSRIIVRFDTLPSTFRAGAVAADSAITRIDTASLVLRLAYPLLPTPGPVVIEAYDVDTTANDTIPATLLPLFRPDRLLARQEVVPSAATDSVLRIFLDTAAVRRVVVAKTRLRVGLRVRPGSTGQVQVMSWETGRGPTLRLRVSRDTTIQPLIVSPISSTTPGEPFRASQLLDYALHAIPTPAAPSGAIVVGGLRGQRSFLRFDLPRHISDSTTIVRATLELTQFPYRGVDAADTVQLLTHTTLTSGVVRDLQRVVGILGGSSPDTVRLVPRDSGLRQIELAELVRQWRSFGIDSTQRALVLRIPTEASRPAELRFFSRQAPPALRPRLRLVYVPRTTFGQP